MVGEPLTTLSIPAATRCSPRLDDSLEELQTKAAQVVAIGRIRNALESMLASTAICATDKDL